MRQEQFLSERSHHSQIFAALENLLREAEPIDLLVIGTGPGSYTGVRIAISAAIGLSLAQNIPMIGLPSLVAAEGAPGHYAVVGDARRDSWHFSEVRAGVLLCPPVAGSAEEIQARCAGCGVPVLTFDDAPPPFFPAATVKPSASLLAERAAALTIGEREALAAQTIEPLYLAAPFVTVPKARAGVRISR
jgi:tRNA threonylcarbamoyladenosine biosynthesis protein TsaB